MEQPELAFNDNVSYLHIISISCPNAKEEWPNGVREEGDVGQQQEGHGDVVVSQLGWVVTEVAHPLSMT